MALEATLFPASKPHACHPGHFLLLSSGNFTSAEEAGAKEASASWRVHVRQEQRVAKAH